MKTTWLLLVGLVGLAAAPPACSTPSNVEREAREFTALCAESDEMMANRGVALGDKGRAVIEHQLTLDLSPYTRSALQGAKRISRERRYQSFEASVRALGVGGWSCPSLRQAFDNAND